MILKINCDPRLKLNYTDLDNALGKPEIFTITDFDNGTVNKLQDYISDCHTTGQEVIPIVINSDGGYAHSVIAMIDLIQASEVPVATIVTGTAQSGGSIFCAFGTPGYRYIAPNARIMIHEVASGKYGKIEELKTFTDESSKINTLLYQLMAKQCGKNKNYFIDKIHENGHADWFFDADEALKHGMVDKIGLPKLMVDISVKYSLTF